jgi:hypothetical protein
MERQRRGWKTDRLGNGTCRQTFRPLLDQEPKDREAMLMRERTESSDGFR